MHLLTGYFMIKDTRFSELALKYENMLELAKINSEQFLKQISFQYIDILPTKEIVLRHDGKEYKVSPQVLVWNDDRYYAPSYSEEKKFIVPWFVLPE